MKELLKKYKVVLIILIVVIFFCFLINKEEEIADMRWQDKETIEEMQQENEKNKTEIMHLEGRIEELETKNNDLEELVDILQEQLESHGIKPKEL